MRARQLWFAEPRAVTIREQTLPAPGPQQVRLRTRYSAISAGTEMLVYRGQLPAGSTLDDSLSAYADQAVEYPLQYGYACVGDIEAVGAEVAQHWVGKTVFAFVPHASHHLCPLDAVIEVPDGINAKQALFLANMETAVNLAQDGNLRLGERAVVLGQGIVGLLLSSVLGAAGGGRGKLGACADMGTSRAIPQRASGCRGCGRCSGDDVAGSVDRAFAGPGRPVGAGGGAGD